MIQIKSLLEIKQDLINSIHDLLPNVNTMENNFISNVFINPEANQISQLYEQIKNISDSQSILYATGSDLDKLAMNYFIERKVSTKSTGKIRFYFGSNPIENDILINRGTIVSTKGSVTEEQINYETIEDVIVYASNMNSYSYDNNVLLYYVDVPAESMTTGSNTNKDPGMIHILQTPVDNQITNVTNYNSFTGGQDEEDDLSLVMRVNLAISGSNIGTKDGYLSFVLKQQDVQEAVVVGAGEPLMLRDEGQGGMVDIYIRGYSPMQITKDFNVTSEYVYGNTYTPAYDNIILDYQPLVQSPSNQSITNNGLNPILDVYSLTGSINETTKTYTNSALFSFERGSDNFYRDVQWISNLPINVANNIFNTPSDTILIAGDENGVSKSLSYDNSQNLVESAVIGSGGQFISISPVTLSDWQYINPIISILNIDNIRYDIDWSLIQWDLDSDPIFNLGKTPDNIIYMVQVKGDNLYENLRYKFFIKNNGHLFERRYFVPDFQVVHDISPTGRGTYEKGTRDSIKWLNSNINNYQTQKPIVGEILSIEYNHNSIISNLQSQIENVRVITADVMIKQAQRIGIEIYVEVVPNELSNPEQIRINVASAISNFISGIKKLKSSLNRSDIVYVARGVNGVTNVSVDNVKINITGEAPTKEISAKDYQYIELDNILVIVDPYTAIV